MERLMPRNWRRAMPKTQPAAPTVEVASVPDWLQQAYKHFQETGFYRPEDIIRVLGSQREGVELRAETEWSANWLTR
jgi:hypothetical protein